MTRAPGADIHHLFNAPAARIAQAERILRAIENSHDTRLLIEMNGERCAGRQVSKFRWYDRPARESYTRKEKQT
jgi:citrate lyase beta subunit